MASGRVFSNKILIRDHWEIPGRKARYAQVEWEDIVDAEDRLPIELLKTALSDFPWDGLRASGVECPAGVSKRLERLWSKHLGLQMFHSPEELSSTATYSEGSVSTTQVNRYERDPRAREACLSYFGHACTVCGLDFKNRYGPLGKDFIHVHHLRELSTVKPGYRVNPRKDLRPVCPNCHAMLHRTQPALTPAQLKTRITRAHAQGRWDRKPS